MNESDVCEAKDEVTHLENRHGFDSTGVLDVRTTTQIDHRSTSVDGGGGAVRDLVIDEVDFERVVLNSKIRKCDSQTEGCD